MFLDPNDPRLGDTPGLVFRTYWPSQDTLLDSKVSEILKSGLGMESVIQSAMASSYDALRIALRNKATVLGDMLSKQLATVATFKTSPVGQVLQGVFAHVEWGAVRDNPAQAASALAQVGVPLALTTLTSLPIAGQLASAYFAMGLKLADMVSQPNPLLLPWSEYSRDTDEDLTGKVVLGIYSKSVDQTNVFRPPWNPNTEWRIGVAGDPTKPKGYVWAPWDGKGIPWRSDGLGSMPGTMRIFGHVQCTAPRSHAAELERWVRMAPGFTPKDMRLRWPSTVTNTGDFYPSGAQACGMLGSMAGNVGAPDMFKVHVPLLLEEWERAFETLEGSFADRWNNPGALLKDMALGQISMARQILSDAQSGLIAVRLSGASEWSFGTPWDVPSNWGVIVPGVYSGGKPGDPVGRTDSLWIEEDARRDPKVAVWPYGSKPKQHACSRYNACSSDLAATIDPEILRHPAAWSGGNVPKGYRKMPWPPPEIDAAQFASPFEVFIKPALRRLRLQQERSLKTTLVCAYVRPDDSSGMPAYGAFRDPSLRELCLKAREILLTHKLRFRVDLKDVEAIDPGFAVRLKQSGVTGSPLDFSKSLDLAADASLMQSEQAPANEGPQGGIPFAHEVAGLFARQPRWVKLAAAIGGATLVSGAVGYAVHRWARS